jgi:hypothetical protein
MGPQATKCIASHRYNFERFLALIKSGEAYRRGLYWAMFTGEDLDSASTDEDFGATEQGGAVEGDKIAVGRNKGDEEHGAVCRQFQASLRQLVGVEAAVLSLPCLRAWTSAPDANLMSLWWGPGGHTEQLHYDGHANIHFQLRGSKTWRLFAPHHDLEPACCLRGQGSEHNFSTLSLVHAQSGSPIACNGCSCHSGAEKKVRAALRDEMCFTVHPGEAIYVPSGWWHQVSGHADSADYTVSVNLFEPDSASPWDRRLLWHFFRLSPSLPRAAATFWGWVYWHPFGTDSGGTALEGSSFEAPPLRNRGEGQEDRTKGGGGGTHF